MFTVCAKPGKTTLRLFRVRTRQQAEQWLWTATCAFHCSACWIEDPDGNILGGH